MSFLVEPGESQRPYTVGSFQVVLEKFNDLISDITYRDAEATPEERRQWITENLRFDQFCDRIRGLFGSDIKNQDLKSIYRKISTNPDAQVDWSELFGFFQTMGAKEDPSGGEEVSVFMVSKRERVGEAAGDRRRRDSVQMIRHIKQLDACLSISQKGAICLWTNKLRLQNCLDIQEATWSTGCDYLTCLRRVVITTERSIAIWDPRTKTKQQGVTFIKPIEHSPQCVVALPSNGQVEDRILYGDDQGYVSLLRLNQNDLNLKSSKGDKRSNESPTNTIDPSKLSKPILRRKLHNDWILKIKYFPELRCFASCSPNSLKSFALEEVENVFFKNGETKCVSVPKGVNAFDFCARANIIATGGVDKVVRVWHPHIFSRPTGKLSGHLFTITDIVINDTDQHIISLSTARVFRIWDIHTLTCLQIFTDNENRPGEKRIFSMAFDNGHERLLTGSSVIDSWPLTRAVQDTMQVPHTHDRSIVQVLFNKELNQVVSVCTESNIKVWEMESGRIVYNIPEAHGPNVEVTSLAIDKSGSRLVSGAFDGSLKIWDFGSGELLKSYTVHTTIDEDLSIYGILYYKVDEDYHILASGWTNETRLLIDAPDSNGINLVKTFSDFFILSREKSMIREKSMLANRNEENSKMETSLRQRNSFTKVSPLPDIGQPRAQVTQLNNNEKQILKDHEMTCMVDIDEDLLATGCTNGNIIFWSKTKACVDKVYIIPKELLNKAAINKQGAIYRRVNDMKVLRHKIRRAENILHQTSGTEDVHNVHTKRTDPITARDIEISTNNGETVKHNINDIDQESDAVNSGLETRNIGRRVSNQVKDVTLVVPSTKQTVQEFDPILCTVHQDSFIRFWSMDGMILREVSPLTRKQGKPVTSVAHDEDVNYLFTGDTKGYITMWDVTEFLQDPESENTDCLKQVVCWRAHMNKIVSLTYVETQRVLLSGSIDGSIRVWWGKKGKFVGFFGQHRVFNFPSSSQMLVTSQSLPYDITEKPLAPMTRKSAAHKIRSVQKFEYPLIFDQEKWQPFQRPDSDHREEEINLENKKFFGALIKPRAYNFHLESFPAAEQSTGAVFRALPVYRVRTPERPLTPVFSSLDEGPLHGKTRKTKIHN